MEGIDFGIDSWQIWSGFFFVLWIMIKYFWWAFLGMGLIGGFNLYMLKKQKDRARADRQALHQTAQSTKAIEEELKALKAERAAEYEAQRKGYTYKRTA